MMRVAVLSIAVLVVSVAVFLLWQPPQRAPGIVDAGTLATSSTAPSAPLLVPTPPPAAPTLPDPGCRLTTWDELILESASGPPPPPGERDQEGVDDRFIGPAMAAPTRIGSIRAGPCAGAVVYRFFGPVQVAEGGCVDADRFLVDGSIDNACDDAPDALYQSARRPVGYTAETATTVVLLEAMGDVSREALAGIVAGRVLRRDTTSTLPGLPLAREIVEPDMPPWELQTVAYSTAQAHALGIAEIPCLSPRQGAEGAIRRCKDTLRITRPDGVVAIYVPTAMNVVLEGYVVRPLPADRAGFQVDVPVADGAATVDGGAAVDAGAIARATARAAGHEVSVLQRSGAEAMLERARATAQKAVPPQGEPLEDDAEPDRTDPHACRSTTCREAWDAFMKMGLDEFMALTPAIMVTDRYGRRLHFVRVLFEFPLR